MLLFIASGLFLRGSNHVAAHAGLVNLPFTNMLQCEAVDRTTVMPEHFSPFQSNLDQFRLNINNFVFLQGYRNMLY